MQNYKENGKFIGMFQKGDDVIYTPWDTSVKPKLGKVTQCFGWRLGGYAYVVTFAKDCFAHVQEDELRFVE